jgi:hypothetical protein
LNIVGFFHEFTKEQTPQNKKPCARLRDAARALRRQHPAILPWFLVLGWRPSFRVGNTGTLPVSPSEPDCCWTFSFRPGPFGKSFPAFFGSRLKDMTASALCPSRIIGSDTPNKVAHESIMQKRAPNDARVLH